MQIVVLLCQIELLMLQSNAAPVACQETVIAQQGYSRWRKKYGGLEADQAGRMKEPERENVRLKCLVLDLWLDARGAGGISEAKDVGADPDMIRFTTAHSQVSTTVRYVRSTIGKSRKVVELRA